MNARSSGTNMFTINRATGFYISLIILMSLIITSVTLGWEKPFIGDDRGVTNYFPDTMITFYYHMWDWYTAPGKAAVTSVFGFVWGHAVYLLFKLGLPPVLTQRVEFFALFAICGLAAFFFLTVLMQVHSHISDKRSIYFGAFTGTMLYMFNHFTMHLAGYPGGAYNMSYMFLPLVLGLFIYNLHVRTSYPNIVIFSISAFLMAGGNPSNTLSITLFMIAYLIFFLPQIKRSPSRPFLFLSVSGILVLLSCSFMVLPILSVGTNPYGKLAFTQEAPLSFGFNSTFTSFLNLFYLASVSTWPNFPYYKTYTDNNLFILLGYSLPIFALASLLFYSGRRIKAFFCLTIVIALFFAKGVHPPFENLFEFIAYNVPGFGMYRNVYLKFVFYAILSYSVLIALFASHCLASQRISRGRIGYLAVLPLLAICIFNIPFLTQDIVNKDYLAAIPQEYDQLAEVAEKDTSDFKVISLPPAPGGRGHLLDWGENDTFVGQYPDPFFLNNAAIDSYWFLAYKLVESDSWGSTKFEENLPSALKYAGILNAKYLLLHKDFLQYFDFGAGGGLHFFNSKLRRSVSQSILGKLEGVTLVKDSDRFAIYKLDNRYFLPHIYPSDKSLFVVGDMPSLPWLTKASHLVGRPAIFFSEFQGWDTLLAFLNYEQETVSGGIAHPKSEKRNLHPLDSDLPPIFANRSVDSLAVEMARVQLLCQDSRRSSLDGLRSFFNPPAPEEERSTGLVKFGRDDRAILNIVQDGDYEIWASNETSYSRFVNDLDLHISIGKMDFPLTVLNTANTLGNNYKWTKVTDIHLQKKEYRLHIYDVMSRPIDTARIPTFLVLAKDKLTRHKSMISSRPVGYLFWVDKERALAIVKANETTKTKNYRNPYYIPANPFHISKDGNYLVKAFIKPKRVFVPDKSPAAVNITNGGCVSTDALKGWNIRYERLFVRQNLSEEGMQIKAYPTQTAISKSNIVLTKEFPSVKLKENPYLFFSCTREFPDIQSVDIFLHLRDERTNRLYDKTIHVYPREMAEITNVFGNAIMEFGEKAADHLCVTKAEIVLKLAPPVRRRHLLRFIRILAPDETPTKMTKSSYTFTFKNFAFFKRRPKLVNMNEAWHTRLLPEYFYYSEKNGTFGKAKFYEQIPSYVKNIVRQERRRFIDLKERPVLSFDFKKDSYNSLHGKQMEPINCPEKFKVLLGLDLTGDEKQDAEMELFLPAIPKDNSVLRINIKAYEMVKKSFPGSDHYNLLRVHVGDPDVETILYNDLLDVRNTSYTEHVYSPSDLEIGAAVLRLDSQSYGLPEDYERHEENGLYCLEYGKINLKEGDHVVEAMDNEKFRVEMIEIIPVTNTGQRRSAAIAEAPGIDFKKINPTRYIVNVTGARGPFTLVFSESYNDKWQAYIRQKSDKGHNTEPWSAVLSLWNDRGNRIEVKDHFLVNGYANGWMIPAPRGLKIQNKEPNAESAKGKGEDFQIVIAFKPQSFFEIGLFITATTLLGCFGYLVYCGTTRGKNPANDD